MSGDVVEVHRAVLAQLGPALRADHSEIKGTASVHVMPDTVSLSQLCMFQRVAGSGGRAGMSAMGSIDGKTVFSVNSRPRPALALPKKRARDTSREEAERACARVKKSGECAAGVAEETYERARDVLAGLIKLRGLRGESPVEAWGLSLRTAGQWGAPMRQGGESGSPVLVVCARISGGVAVGVRDVLDAVGPCKDGLVTVDANSVSADFDLPQTEQSLAAQDVGQRSLLLLASVPGFEKE